MIIQPRVWGYVCASAHPVGCERNVLDDIETVTRRSGRSGGPRNVLVVGASTGYGLAARIVAAFGYGAATLGVFREKAGTARRSASAGWYNSAAFDEAARHAGLVSLSLNGDAYAHETRARAMQFVRDRMPGPIDLVIYSLAAPMRRLPNGDETVHTVLKPIDQPFIGFTTDMECDKLVEVKVDPASEEEIDDTVAVMGGDDWALWLEALASAGVLAPNARTLAFSYVGPEFTRAIYRDGTIGRAKIHLEGTADRLRKQGVDARVAVMKFIVSQASAAIPGISIYASLILRVMKDRGVHEGAIEQQERLFRDFLYRGDGAQPVVDAAGRLRLDDLELREDVQQACARVWQQVTEGNLLEVTDYASYKREFLRLFGFAREDVDYAAEVNPEIRFDCETV